MCTVDALRFIRAKSQSVFSLTLINIFVDVQNCQIDRTLDLSEGERGCAASHVELWKRCAGQGRPLLVLEDDVLFSNSQVASWCGEFIEALSSSFAAKDQTFVLYLGAEADLRQAAPSLHAQQAIWAARATSAECELKQVPAGPTTTHHNPSRLE